MEQIEISGWTFLKLFRKPDVDPVLSSTRSSVKLVLHTLVIVLLQVIELYMMGDRRNTLVDVLANLLDILVCAGNPCFFSCPRVFSAAYEIDYTNL